MVAQPQPKRMSVAEFMALPNDGNRHELVRGELRVMPPPPSRHGRVEAAVMEAIGRYLDNRARALGWDPRQGLGARDRLVGFIAVGEVGLQFTLPDDPNQIRGADGVYVPPEQLAAVEWDGEGYFPTVPHLVVEVISPSESADDVAERVQDYLAGGAPRVWCIYLRRRMVHIHDAAAPLRVVRGNDNVTDDLLPDFSLPLNLVFPE
jgi:Uma2 family endonuclease